MTQTLDVTGSEIDRPDGSTVHAVVYKNATGEVIGKAYVPVGYKPTVSDKVDSHDVYSDVSTFELVSVKS